MAALHFSEAEFNKQVLEGRAEALVDFWAPWCGPCKMLGPVIDGIADELAGSTLVAKINIDENPAVAERYGVMSIPTIIVFRGGEEVARQVGLVPKDSILALLK